jgi:hypothetical protein
MNNDKVYLALNIRCMGTTYVPGVGTVMPINLYNILKQKYYKYNAFNIKLESYPHSFTDTSSITGERVTYLHLSGLNWINGYDNLTQYSNSRVLEVISQNAFIVSNNTGFFTFHSNCNSIGFYRPSIPQVNLTFFYTDSNGLFYDKVNAFGGEFFFTLSITGIDAYKVQNPHKGIRYSYPNKASSTFTIKYYDGESIDDNDTIATKGRVRIFRNINIKSIIGNENYYKYNKFALIVRKVVYFAIPGVSYANGNFFWNLWMNFDNVIFEFDNVNQQTIIGSTVPTYFKTYPQFICSLSGTVPLRIETYIENIFLKPTTDTTNLTIAYSTILGLGLPPPNNANDDLFPKFAVTF